MDSSQSFRAEREFNQNNIMCILLSPKTPIKVRKDLIKHMAKNMKELRLKYPTAKTIILGDRNELPVKELLKISGNSRQIVDKPTRKGKILDVILTDMQYLFKEVKIVPPVPVDEGETGIPSDHDGFLVEPLKDTPTNKIITVHPMSTHKLNEVGSILAKEKWNNMTTDKS